MKDDVRESENREMGLIKLIMREEEAEKGRGRRSVHMWMSNE